MHEANFIQNILIKIVLTKNEFIPKKDGIPPGSIFLFFKASFSTYFKAKKNLFLSKNKNKNSLNKKNFSPGVLV